MSENMTKKTLTITQTSFSGKWMEFWFKEEQGELMQGYDGEMYESWVHSCKPYVFQEKINEAQLGKYLQNNGAVGLITTWVSDGGNWELDSISKPVEQVSATFPLTPIFVKDALPNTDGSYLVWVKHSFPKNYKGLIAEFYTDNDTFYSEADEHPLEDVTHWAELPPTPDE